MTTMEEFKAQVYHLPAQYKNASTFAKNVYENGYYLGYYNMNVSGFLTNVGKKCYGVATKAIAAGKAAAEAYELIAKAEGQ